MNRHGLTLYVGQITSSVKLVVGQSCFASTRAIIVVNVTSQETLFSSNVGCNGEVNGKVSWSKSSS